MTSRPNFSSESIQLEQPRVVKLLESSVPTPFFSGEDPLHVPSAISFAPATIELATPMIHGTLMSEFHANPRVLRDGDDTFPTENFAHLVITWPGINWEWKVPMSNIAQGRNRISRKELAQFVVEQFNSFVSIMGARSWLNPEWMLGEAPNAYNTSNTCLMFLFTPAPLVWQPAFRVKNQFPSPRSQLPVLESAP